MDQHDVAQICSNGHVINPRAESSPQFSKKFCAQCGASTTTQCQQCKANIQGEYPGWYRKFPVPAFCSECGAPYPWTEAKLQAARDLTQELEGLDDADKKALQGTFDDLVKDTPQTQVAARKFKKLLSTVGKEGGTALREVLVSVLSETAKKALGLP